MFTVYAIHAPTVDHLAEVKAEMIVRGAPTIEVVDCGDYYMALEGSHRLAAAADLGLTPELTIHEYDDMLDITVYDWYEGQTWACGETVYSAGEVAGELLSYIHAVPYSFDA